MTFEIDRSLQDLYDILSLKRPANSKGEWELIKRFLIPIGCNRDDFGNWYIRVGDAPILWSSHTDTVHHLTHETDIVQKLEIDEDGILSTSNGSCLGADCGAGIWLMLRMIRAGVEGLYVFHRQEEVGGKGSKWIKEHNPDFLKGIKFAIAFDRKGTKSIITHQWTGRCCSDSFALSLAKALNMDLKPDDTGLFTDTANYNRIIPECTNLSVGYHNEHTFSECLETFYLKQLLEHLIQIDTTKLVLERNPKADPENENWYWNQWVERHYSEHEPSLREEDSIDRSIRLIENNGYVVAEVLQEWGVLDDLVREIEFRA